MFHIEFYETEDGKQPVSDFLDSLDAKMAAKMISLMEILEEKGTELRLPYSSARVSERCGGAKGCIRSFICRWQRAI